LNAPSKLHLLDGDHVPRGSPGLLIEEDVAMTFYRTLTLAGSVVLLSTGAFAQAMSDADYCHELSSLYRMFARFQTANAVAAAAMNECDKGNYSVGISRLEEILTGRKIPLPPRKG
jgi:hypothetical protein